MGRPAWIILMVLVIPLFSGCNSSKTEDTELRDWATSVSTYLMKEAEWNTETALPALEMLCDLEKLIYLGIPDGSGGYLPWVDHAPIPSTVRRWCSIPGAGDPPAPPQPPPAWGD